MRREVGRERKIVTALVDLKSAFDSVNSKIMKRKLEKGRINRILRERIMKIYEETKSVVKINDEFKKSFWTTKGVR